MAQTTIQDSVIGVVAMNNDTKDSLKSYLNQRIIVKTRGIDSLIFINESIVLFINGIPINSSIATPSIKNRQNLIFNIGDTAVANEIWSLFYVPNKSERKFTISAGINDGDPLPASKDNFTIIFYSKNWLYGAYLTIVLLLIAFIILIRKSNIIKEPNTSIDPPFSLARTQFAFWTFIIVK
ncbi:hypothetical protein GXP67_14430 [Rhodocytophaga rosea]|uniref:Uncharacterized protein n=1 Tax=Rhodocytophaga rosea TaxID=2704465 RepID=A0A6C0GIS4_9BACT|nr:hypothetical protein [Rhodocytophaga rosea]QHT67744.1 hypothetical protein GXP67_14430 [Rhodocytophaga rosea]